MVTFAMPVQQAFNVIMNNESHIDRETTRFYLRELDQLPPIRGDRIHPIKYIFTEANITSIPEMHRTYFLTSTSKFYF